MSIRGSIVFECDRPKCHAEIVVAPAGDDYNIENEGLNYTAWANGWRVDDDGIVCPQCADDGERDEAYERAAARARNNDFADTGGKDWT